VEHYCNIQYSEHGLTHNEDCFLNGNILDNNKVKQELKPQINEITSENTSKVVSNNKLHNNRIGHKFQILNRRTN